MAQFTTPGVFIDEINSFPNSVVAVETSIPVFIGYTEKAEFKGKDVTRVPTKITSLKEYTTIFGQGLRSKIVLEAAASNSNEEILVLNSKSLTVKYAPNNELYLYNGLRFFYANGGGSCYILSVGNFANVLDKGISIDDFLETDTITNVFTILENEAEPTLILIPDAVVFKEKDGEGHFSLYQQALQHCGKTRNRISIFDLPRSSPKTSSTAAEYFRNNIGTEFLDYGVAYYPWLHTTVVTATEVDFRNLHDSVELADLLPLSETGAHAILANGPGDTENSMRQFHETLLSASPTYKKIIETITAKINLLPPSSALAGIYNFVDSSRGVWKAPANVGVNSTTSPEVKITNEEQASYNIDALTGKSINIIREFPGIGMLVWGARTLDGNSLDWRYISIRRTCIMIEQSIITALRVFIFQPNTETTWSTIRESVNNFLNSLWKQGALYGAKPEDAYNVQLGLGSTMTAGDVAAGRLNVNILIAVLRPAEFIMISLQQQQQTA